MNNNKTLGWLLVALPLTSQALEFEFNDGGVQMALDSTVTYGAQWRVEDRDDKITGKRFVQGLQNDFFGTIADRDYVQEQAVLINGNDGNYNFDKGLISNRLTLLVDMDVTWKNYGFFVRGKAFYDTVYHDDTDMGQFGYTSYNSGKLYGGDAGRGDANVNHGQGGVHVGVAGAAEQRRE